MFDDTARGLAVAWVLFEGVTKPEAACRLRCNYATVAGWNVAYIVLGEWWSHPVIRNRHADNACFDSHFLRDVDAVVRSDTE